jgi:hypothetical protein
MAGHRFQDSVYNLEKYPVVLWGYFTAANWDATDWATTDVKTAAKSLGITSIIRTGAGAFTVTLIEKYHSVLCLAATVDSSDSSLSSVDLTEDDVDGSTPVVKITLRDHAGSAADPPDGDKVLLRLELRNSSTG